MSVCAAARGCSACALDRAPRADRVVRVMNLIDPLGAPGAHRGSARRFTAAGRDLPLVPAGGVLGSSGAS